MIQAYLDAHPEEDWGPSPAVIRAALVATAQDLSGRVQGRNADLDAPTPYAEGPDYVTGYGLVWAPDAVAVLEEHTRWRPHFLTEEVSAEDEERTWILEVPEAGRLQVALAWDDPAAAVLAENTLQNDLDLRLQDPLGGLHLPWVLDPTEPTQPATRGDNSRDNLEVVTAEATEPGFWRVVVSGKQWLTQTEELALVATLDGAPLPWPGDEPPLPAQPRAQLEEEAGCACAASEPLGGKTADAFWGLLLLALWRGRASRQSALPEQI